MELERHCQELIQEVKLLSERQEVLAGLVEDKSRLQRKATEKYDETIFERKSRKTPWYSNKKSTFCHDVKVKGIERESC